MNARTQDPACVGVRVKVSEREEEEIVSDRKRNMKKTAGNEKSEERLDPDYAMLGAGF